MVDHMDEALFHFAIGGGQIGVAVVRTCAWGKLGSVDDQGRATFVLH
jgi:hypothetical protein